MKILKVLLTLILTVGLLVFARMTTKVRSVHLDIKDQGIAMQHDTVPKVVGKEKPNIGVKVDGTEEVFLNYKIGSESEYKTKKMLHEKTVGNLFSSKIPSHKIGEKAWYFIEARKRDGEKSTSVYLPRDKKPVRLKFEGKVPALVIIIHVLSMFGAVFFGILSLFAMYSLKKDKISLRKSLVNPLITFLLLFIGILPSGIAMNYYAFGVYWEAFPFGRDITDNKSQIAFLFWIITLFLVKGSIFGNEEKNIIGKSAYIKMIIISFIVTIATYLIPHSL